MNKYKYFILFLITNICFSFSNITNNISFADQETSIAENAVNSEDTYEYTENDIVYQLDKNKKMGSVIKVKNYDTKKIIIPEKVHECTVTKIDKRAFGESTYKNWKTIILPNSVTELGEESFRLCRNLSSIKLPKNLTKIGNNCFEYCCNLKSIKIPDSVDYIGEGAFSECISLKNINVPKSLTKLNNELFSHCISLKKLNIHKNITIIEPRVFEKCLTNVNLQYTTVDKENHIYKKQDSCIVNKKDGAKVIEFAKKDDIYKQKVEFSKKLYKTMQTFLKENKNCDVNDFDDVCIKYLKQHCNPQKLLTKDEFKKKQQDQITLYRGVTKKEYLDDFKQGKIFFAPNTINEKGNGIYVTSEYEQAKYFMFDQSPKYQNKLLKYFEEHPELEEMEESNPIEVQKIVDKIMKETLPYGGIITMFIDKEAKILDNNYLDECKDLIFKLHHKKFKDATPFNGQQIPEEGIKSLQIYKTKEEKLIHNSGLLARLLNYDAIYTKNNQLYLDNTVGCSEYLVVNPEILNVLAD